MSSNKPTVMYADYEKHFTTLSEIAMPRVTRAIGWLMTLSVIGIAVFLTLTPWVQTTSGPGTVTALNPEDRLQEINALVSGRIQKWFVRDGSHVKAGDPIVQIVDNDPMLLARLQAEREQVMAKIAAAENATATAILDLERSKELYEAGLAARRDYEQAQIRVQELRAREAESNAELNRVDVRLSRQSLQLVRAPRDGVILRVNAGDTSTFIEAGQIVATFVPDDVERAIEIFIDGRDVPLVQSGDKVRLQFEGWPVVQFSGWPSIAIGTFGGQVLSVDPSADVGGVFRVLVVEDPDDQNPWPSADFVRFGSAARGWILLEQVTVGFEIWRQLNNFPPRFRPGETA